jgi:hypothetical protein
VAAATQRGRRAIVGKGSRARTDRSCHTRSRATHAAEWVELRPLQSALGSLDELRVWDRLNLNPALDER